MTKDFTKNRAMRFLSDYESRVESLLNQIEYSDDELEDIISSGKSLLAEINAEIKRSSNQNNVVTENTLYEPAIQEVSMYLEGFISAESDSEASDKLHDAQFSIGYYLEQLKNI